MEWLVLSLAILFGNAAGPAASLEKSWGSLKGVASAPSGGGEATASDGTSGIPPNSDVRTADGTSGIPPN